MPHSIIRIYALHESANAAVIELRDYGFNAHIVDAEPFGLYSEYIQRGEVPVIVNDPPFGKARFATDILESHKPIESDIAVIAYDDDRQSDWNSAAPLSSWLGWTVLLNDPMPLSTLLKWPTIKSNVALSKTLEGIRKQSNKPAPLSTVTRLPLLIENDAPLSHLFRWRLLSDNAAWLSQRFKWPVLFGGAAPLSNKLGWCTLWDNPTPLSSVLHLRVLFARE